MLRLLTLGSLELLGADFANQKPLLLLAFLALEGPQSRGRLASLFWPFASDSRNRLSVTVSRVNKSLGAALVADGSRLATTLSCDVVELRAALAAGDHARIAECYRGRLLAGVSVAGLGEELHEWIESTGDDLARKVQSHYLSAARTAAAVGSFKAAGDLVTEVLTLTDSATLSPEQLRLAHDVLLAGGEPLAEELRPEVEDLGFEPASTTATARQRLMARAVPISAGLRSEVATTPLLGRDAELRLLKQLLSVERRRLVTVAGPGGIGKTRVASAAAEQLAPGLGGAAWAAVVFLDCSQVDSEAAVLSALYQALDLPVPLTGAAPQHLGAELARRGHVLAVLDAFEHLTAHARVLSPLLRASPELQLLVTSVQPLGLPEEWVLSLPGLGDPERSGDDAALELFAERARQVDASFELSAGDAAQVAAICRLTGGNPLAIELAAGWVTVMPVAAIAEEVARGLDILEAAGKPASGRHASIRAVFERSRTLLEASERDCLQRLTVFRGGFDLASAKAVADAGYKELAALCRKSMVARSHGGRFELPEILRSFVVEGMTDRDQLLEVRARHAAQVRSTVLEASRHVNDADGGSSLESMYQESGNIAAAMNWALEANRFDVLADLVEAQADYWIRRGLLDQAERWYTALEGLAEGVMEPRRLANVLRHHSFISFIRADLDGPLRLLQLSLALCQAAGDAEGEGRTYAMLGIRAVYLGDYATARDHYLEALGVGHVHGLDDVVARALNNLGDVHRFEGDFDRAQAYYEESLALVRRLGDFQMVSNVLGSLAVVALTQGRFAAAEGALRESLRLIDVLGITFSLGAAFEQYAYLFVVGQEPLLAAELLGAADALRRRLGTPLEPFAAPEVRAVLELAKGAAGVEEFDRRFARGGGLATGQALDLALSEGALLAARVAAGSSAGHGSGANPTTHGTAAAPS